MAGRAATLTVKILTDASQAGKGLDDAASRVDKFRSGVDRMVPAAAATVGALGLVGKAAVDSASRQQQAFGGLEAVFKSNADTVKAWANNAKDAVGLSASEYAEFATQLGGSLKNAGVPMDEIAGKTDQMIRQAADLAATYGGTTADAVGALGAALRGEADPAERFNLNLKASQVNAELAAKGIKGAEQQTNTAARAQATLALVTKQGADAWGQFAKESDTAAVAGQKNAAAWEDAKAALGDALLPAVTQVTDLFSQLATWVQQNSTLVLMLAGVLGTLASGVLVVAAAFRVWDAVTKAVTIAQWAMNSSLLANPVTWVVVAVLALVAGIVLLWQKNEGFRNFVTAAWKAIQQAAITAWNAIKNAVMAVVDWIVTKINQAKAIATAAWSLMRQGAQTAWNGIKSVVSSVANWINARIQWVRDTVNAVWNAIKSAGTSTWNSLKSTVTSVLNAILSPINAVKRAFDNIVNAVKSVIDWIGRIKIPEINLPFGLGRSAAAVAGAPAVAGPSLAAMRSPTLADAVGGLGARLALGKGGNLTVINVRGTLNDTDSARAVRRVLRTDDRRRGGVVIDRRVRTAS